MVDVRIDQLADVITQAVREYTEDVTAGIERELDSISKAVLKDTKSGSPVDTGDYKKGWTRKKQTSGGQINYTIYNKDEPGLVHLLEFGHAKQSGGRVEAYPHLRPAYDAHVPQMTERIRRIIQNGGRS